MSLIIKIKQNNMKQHNIVIQNKYSYYDVLSHIKGVYGGLFSHSEDNILSVKIQRSVIGEGPQYWIVELITKE